MMRFLIHGMMHKQIGAELGISVIAVKAHRSNPMRKMGAHSLTELVTMVMSPGPVRLIKQPGPATVRVYGAARREPWPALRRTWLHCSRPLHGAAARFV